MSIVLCGASPLTMSKSSAVSRPVWLPLAPGPGGTVMALTWPLVLKQLWNAARSVAVFDSSSTRAIVTPAPKSPCP